jgi:hypothetical protein
MTQEAAANYAISVAAAFGLPSGCDIHLMIRCFQSAIRSRQAKPAPCRIMTSIHLEAAEEAGTPPAQAVGRRDRGHRSQGEGLAEGLVAGTFE